MNINDAEEMIEVCRLAGDSLLIKGVHGIGKSNIVRQYAKKKKYHIKELFLSHQDVGDLIGIPETIQRNGKSIMVWSVPEWLEEMYEKAEQGITSVLFLDELNRAPLDIRQASMNLALEGRIHQHTLPIVNGQKTIVVSAINPPDLYQVDEMDVALEDRFCTITVEPDVESWLFYAQVKELNRIIYKYIMKYPDRLHWMPDTGKGSTPRAWEKVSHSLDHAESMSQEALRNYIIGKLGSEVGSQFFMFYNDHASLVEVDDIVKAVNENEDKVETIEELAEIVKEVIQDTEAIQKHDLALEIEKAYKDKDNIMPWLTYLYALGPEICITYIKDLKERDHDGAFKKLVQTDVKLNNKQLFIRVFNASRGEQMYINDRL